MKIIAQLFKAANKSRRPSITIISAHRFAFGVALMRNLHIHSNLTAGLEMKKRNKNTKRTLYDDRLTMKKKPYIRENLKYYSVGDTTNDTAAKTHLHYRGNSSAQVPLTF